VTFPNGDVPALARALSELLKNPALLLQYLENAPEHLRRHHPGTVAALYLKFFESVR
jgi:glycosyltransferase involved in cell wall biosynthesis